MTWQELEKTYSGKRVFLTGHTGFKGSWMLAILYALGADVKGYSLEPEHAGDLYHELDGDSLCYASVIGDICDRQKLHGELVRFRPHFVFHLAAQALVRRSYRETVETFDTNVMGTAHVLQAMAGLEEACTGVMITTDKVYENDERGLPFAEGNPLGGYDPYSASKAAAEIVIQSYRRSFFNPEKALDHRKSVASMRAGNVIGGGDWSEDRLIPDIVRAIRSGKPVVLRNPASVRPWQHVLEPVAAYLMLGSIMADDPARFATSYNIGPEPEDGRTVQHVTEAFYGAFGQAPGYSVVPDDALHEAALLTLDNSKIKAETGWMPKLTADEAIQWTAAWYADSRPAGAKCKDQIEQYFGIQTSA